MLILASNSPRRRQLLNYLGIPFEVIVADIDETLHLAEKADVYTQRLAREKALSVAALRPPEDTILAADTTVAVRSVKDDSWTILGKPQNEAEAEWMLGLLRGGTHQVFTAVALIQGNLPIQEDWHARDPLQQPITELCVTQVTMRSYGPSEIKDYIATGDPLDKAGAYAIQHTGFHPVERLDGCATSVVGLPLCLVAQMLRTKGIDPPVQLPPLCRPGSPSNCSLFDKVF